MKLLKYLIILSVSGLIFSSCSDDNLSIAPKNIVQDKDLFTTEDGIQAYMANMYRKLPVEDFRYSPNFVFNESWLVQPVPCMTGEALGRDLSYARSEDAGGNAYFEQAYNLIRNANTFLEQFPEHADNYTEDKANDYLGEAYFIRAFTHFALAKRYGGVPIITNVLEYPEKSISELDKRRDSEEAVYDQIAKDFDKAIELLPESNSLGRATKWAAASFKSRAMLHAGSMAKFHEESLFGADDKRIVGMQAQKAQDYFKQAFDAARLVQEQSPHQLYKKAWAPNDPEAQYQNFVDMFFDKSSSENIFIKDYSYDDSVHGFDAYYVPRQLIGPNGYSAGVNPTLEFVEMFDGIPKNDQGHIEVLNENGNYKLFDDRMDLFSDVEPRLRASIILPGDNFKGEEIDIRRGIYTKDEENISPLLPNPNQTTEPYESFVDSLVSSANASQSPYTLESGEKMNPAGLSGMFYSGPHAGGSFTGFSLRKYLKPDLPTSQTKERSLEHHFIEMRYGEVLLNLAEAAFELDKMGASGENYRNIAFNAINQIRERAGADMLQGAGELTREIVRTERRKELAFERKIWWDLKRWNIIHEEQNNKRYRVLMPFYSEHTGKYFFDARLNEYDMTYDFDNRWYYQQIPNDVIERSSIVQNPGY